MDDLRKKVIRGLECCASKEHICIRCPYFKFEDDCVDDLTNDAISLLKAQEEERKRMLTWLAKFCQHIENLGKPLPDAENLAFFKEKMRRQFGWNMEVDLDA